MNLRFCSTEYNEAFRSMSWTAVTIPSNDLLEIDLRTGTPCIRAQRPHIFAFSLKIADKFSDNFCHKWCISFTKEVCFGRTTQKCQTRTLGHKNLRCRCSSRRSIKSILSFNLTCLLKKVYCFWVLVDNELFLLLCADKRIEYLHLAQDVRLQAVVSHKIQQAQTSDTKKNPVYHNCRHVFKNCMPR